MNSRYKIVLLFVVCSLIVFNFVPQLKQNVSASWWDTDWDYYKTIEISNPIEDYQMKLVVEYDDGIDASANVSCEGNCKSDFEDIRFVYDNTTEFPYWIENTTIEKSCTFWVNITTNTSYFEMFYGNDAANNASDGNTTFDVFWSFDDEDITGWAKESGDGNFGIQSNIVRHGSGAIVVNQTGSTNVYVDKALNNPTSDDIRMIYWMRKHEDLNILGNICDGTFQGYVNAFNTYIGSDEKLFYYDGASKDLMQGAIDTWYRVEWQIHNGLTDNNIYIDNVLRATDASPRGSPTEFDNIYLTTQDNVAGWVQGYFDTIIIAKFNDGNTPQWIEFHSENGHGWDYSQPLAWRVLNETGTTILKLSTSGNLAIAGTLYENTNSPPAEATIIYNMNNTFWLADNGDLYFKGEIYEES